ncbi:reverse transcriptase/maturase family protein [Listeria seeligeri]|uniref:reverse transcriptase/maturase family protein n=1 Tax=Listeria seeligeri TaxID=1640 RepID=UPI0022EA2EB6|nr:reverse transcriptase/maturase family protein [Listeria seeligeri]
MLDSTKYKTKNYLHFDHRVKIENVESYVTNHLKIGNHSFLPFIYYVSSFEKRIEEKNPDFDNRPVKIKNRVIMYAGHMDNFIYKYYAEILNEDYYNKFCIEKGIDNCVSAYRNNKTGKSNIDFAAEIVNQTVEYGKAYVLVGDFTNYFDKINHELLKKHLAEVLNMPRLQKDWFNIFRSITKYGYYKKECLNKKIGSDESFKNLKKKSYFENISEFRAFQKENKTQYNTNKFGIPQGSAISAAFANIYASGFDKKLKKIADEYLGIYRRYSDDFILVIPKSKIVNEQKIRSIERDAIEVASKYEIELHKDKTGMYLYENNKIFDISSNEISHLDYLGFVFDGTTVKMRGKSPYKFYRNAKKLIEFANDVKEKKGLTSLPYKKKIYGLCTDLGRDYNNHGNFISYAKRAQEKFDEISPNTNNLIMNQMKNRKKKIEKMLGYKIHTKI